jgi:hypothetical protein
MIIPHETTVSDRQVGGYHTSLSKTRELYANTPATQPDTQLWAAIRSIQVAIVHLRDDVARLATTAAAVLPVAVLGSADERWAASLKGQHLDRLCDQLVLALRTVTEVERRTTDPALRQLCRGALDRMARVEPGARERA